MATTKRVLLPADQEQELTGLDTRQQVAEGCKLGVLTLLRTMTNPGQGWTTIAERETILVERVGHARNGYGIRLIRHIPSE